MAVATPNASARQKAPAPQPLIPFTAASHEHAEPFALGNTTYTVGGAAQQIGPVDVPAFGFIRHVLIRVDITGGTAGPVVLSADYPFSVIQSVTLADVNGAPIYGPLTGYETFIANLVGGYAFRQDVRNILGSSAAFNMSFYLRVPVEINHYDALGCLSNQNAAASYKLSCTLNDSSVYTTQPTALPNVTITAKLEAWTQPGDMDLAGRPQAKYPPAHGTTQYWSKFVKQIVAGQNSVLLPRVGSYIRNIAIIARDVSGVRTDSALLSPVRLQWDQRDLYNEDVGYRKIVSAERINSLTVSSPTTIAGDIGILFYSFSHSNMNRSGDGPPNLWLPTVQSTRLEFSGPAGAAGTWTVLTNDVAPAEINPANRFSENSDTGFRPAVGAARQQ